LSGPALTLSTSYPLALMAQRNSSVCESSGRFALTGFRSHGLPVRRGLRLEEDLTDDA
jgi:hypothetical protein